MDNVYVITVVPKAAPVTTPVVIPIPALVLLLLQVPAGVPSDRVIDKPIHTDEGPSIVDGNGLTVTVVVVKHPVGNI